MLIEKKERELLIRSEATRRDYSDLFLLLKSKETISTDDLPDLGLNAITMGVLTYAKEDLIDEALREWEVTEYKDLESDRIRCELCGTKNRHRYHIANHLNNCELNVGSTCMRRFNNIEQTLARKEEARLRKQGRTSKRLAEINVRFPAISEAINTGYKTVEDGPFVLPLPLYTSTKHVLDEIKKLHDSFVNKSAGTECFGAIEDLFTQLGELTGKITDFNS